MYKRKYLAKDLITVRTCAKCNQHRSKDDSYALAVIAACWRENEMGQLHAQAKVPRMLAKDLGLRKIFIGKVSPINFFGMHTGTIEVDGNRIRKWLATIFRGLLYNDYKQYISSLFSVCMGELRIKGERKVPGVDKLLELIDKTMDGVNYKGANPEIFLYRIQKFTTPKDCYLIDVVFYGGIRAVGASGMELRESGKLSPDESTRLS